MAKIDRQAEFDRMMVAALGTLSNKYGTKSEKIKARAWAILERDPALSSFFHSVNEAGEEAWNEERMRIGRRFARRTEGLPAEIRRDMSKDGAVKSLLPIWRAWGMAIFQTDHSHPPLPPTTPPPVEPLFELRHLVNSADIHVCGECV